MSADIVICSICQMTFDSHEEIAGHTCIKVKEEKIEIFDFKDMISDEKYFKDEFDSENTPEMRKRKGDQGESDKEFKKRKGNPKNEVELKVETNEFQDENQISPIVTSNFELSEQFIVFILQQIDELCESIKNGDPDTNRSSEINENLENAVNSYRNILNLRKEIFVGPRYYNEIEPENEFDIKDVFHDSKVSEINVEKLKVPKEKVKEPKFPEEERKVGGENEAIDQEKIFPEKKKRSGPKKLTKIIYDEKFELVKNQCGRHELSSMAYILNFDKRLLSKRLESEGIKFTKKVTEWTEECDICEMKKNNDELKRDLLIPFLRFNSEKNQFECILCNWFSSDRRKLYSHIRSIHGKEISTKAIPDKKSENNQECDGTSCKKVYGRMGKQFWCKKCGPSGPKKLTKIIDDEKFELVKNQCGRHELSSMAYILNFDKRLLSKRLESEGIKFTKKVTEWTEECDICEMKKNNDELKRDLLIPFLRFNSEKNQFECILCNWFSSDRRKLYSHIRSIHGKEISTKAIPDKKSENNQECDGTSCKKVYGRMGKQFWCKKCLQKKQLAEDMKKKESNLCPECGVTVQYQYLEAHRKHKHNQEKQNCNICLREFPNRIYLTAHRRNHHEKIPCSQCGKLFAARYMNQHIQLIHTTDDQETYLPEHKNGKNYTVKKFGKLGKRVSYFHEGFTYHKMFKNRTTLRCQWARSLTRNKCNGTANLFLNIENPNLSYIEEKNPHNHENKFGTQ